MPYAILSLFLCLIFGFNISADDLDHVAFEGSITDTAGAAIVGAQVTAKNVATGYTRSNTVGADGRYRLARLTPGTYHLRVEASSFLTSIEENIAAAAGTTIRRDFQLSPAPLETHITITSGNAETEVDTTRTVIGGVINRAQIDSLPIESRNPLDLIFTMSGVAPPALSTDELAEGDGANRFRTTPEEVGVFALQGGAPFSNNLTIEGLDNNDDRAARARFIPSVDAVEEVQVITNQFSAEYGRASGGRVNLRLRGGSNQLRGRTSYYFRDARLNANAFHRNADPQRGFRLPFTEHNPNVSLGGPIIPKRAFFFVAYEYDYIADQAEISALLPTATNPAFTLPSPNGANLGSISTDKQGRPISVNGGAEVGLYDLAVSTPKTAHTMQARIDAALGARHNSFALLTLGRVRDERGFSGGRRTLDTQRRTGRDSESLALSDTFTISERSINELRLQYSRLTPADAPVASRPVVLIEIEDPRDVPGNSQANPLTRSGSLLTGASTIGGTDRREDRLQMQETFSYSRGSQMWRAGIDWQMIHSRYNNLEDATGTFHFASPADFLANRPSRYRHRFFTMSELRNNYFGIFVQNDWRIRSNLTLAFGLRWDYESILNDRNNLGPRLSLAWDPTSSGKTVLRAGFGSFYNRALLRTLDDFTLTSQSILVDTDMPGAKSLLDELKFPQVLAPTDARVAQLGINETEFLRRLERGFRIPESYQASVGFEREIRRGLKIEINYVFNRGAHLWREANANAPHLPAGFASFATYLLSRDFDNTRDPITGLRPITTTGNADIVRFDSSEISSRVIQESGKTIVVFGLANQSTSNATSALRAALAAVRNLRPSPQLGQIEELQARGNSFYHGLSIDLRQRLAKHGYLRVAYTFSHLIDDGVVNTSSALVAGDFTRERALSLLDARHRFALSGVWHLPAQMGRVTFAGTLMFNSPRPFNIGINGNDRNLDDVNTDRPNFNGSNGEIRWRRPGEMLDPIIANAFSLPMIGEIGNLPRNAGRGPWQHTFNVRLSREFRLREKMRFQPQVEIFNPFNTSIFSFGAEFVDFIPTSTGNFLVPTRTLKPRTMRVGFRFEY